MYVGITEADARLARFGILGLPPGRVRFPREMPESVIVLRTIASVQCSWVAQLAFSSQPS